MSHRSRHLADTGRSHHRRNRPPFPAAGVQHQTSKDTTSQIHIEDLSSSLSSSSFSSWASDDVVIKKVKRKTVTVYEDDEGTKDRFRRLRTRSHSPQWEEVAFTDEHGNVHTTITKQKKKTWTTVTELENGDVEEVTTTKIITETYEPIDESAQPYLQTPQRSHSKSVGRSSHARTEGGKLYSPAPERQYYSGVQYANDSSQHTATALNSTPANQSRSSSKQQHHTTQAYQHTTDLPPPPESIVVTTADNSRRGSVISKGSANASYVNDRSHSQTTTSRTHPQESPSRVSQQQRSPSISNVSSVEADSHPPAVNEVTHKHNYPPTTSEQADGYGPKKSYSYASLYANTLGNGRPAKQNQESEATPIPPPAHEERHRHASRDGNPPQYTFVHPWTTNPQPKERLKTRTFRYDPNSGVEKKPSPSRSRSTSPSQHVHGPGLSQVMCERCCSRHHHLPLDNSTENPNIGSPLRRLWSEGSVRVADRSTSPRSVSPTPSTAHRQPSYLSPTVSSLAKCTPEGLPQQVTLEPNPNPMPKDMLAADEPSFHGETFVKGTLSRRPSIQSQTFSIPPSRSLSRRNSVESAQAVASIAGYSARSRSPSRSVAGSSTSPSRLELPERKPRRQLVFVKDNVV